MIHHWSWIDQLVVDYKPTDNQINAEILESVHKNCSVAVGRYSGALCELWLPISYYDKDGNHSGQWFDVSWIHRDELASAVMRLLHMRE